MQTQPQKNMFGEQLGPASQYMHEAKDPHQPAKPSRDSYPKHGFHPGLGFEDDRVNRAGKPIGTHRSVTFRSAEHEEQLKKSLAETDGLDPKDWRDNPALFGKEDVKAVSPEEAAARQQQEIEDIKADSKSKDDLIAKLQAQIAAASAPKSDPAKANK